ncbi:hypothetical protein [Acidocella sp.]|uniref:hypothetical protein n=1 Tax=Acidocella sp. TaxID=50710 RepID=UPI0026225BB4|nr:hypothetical protein [Acidocella sp.]
MFRIRPLAALTFLPLLASCAGMVKTAPPTPDASATPLTEATLKTAEQKAYWRGFVAGRHYQAEKDAHAPPSTTPANLTPAAPGTPTNPTSGTATNPAPTTAAPTAPASPPPPHAPKPANTYRPSGIAQPLGN